MSKKSRQNSAKAAEMTQIPETIVINAENVGSLEDLLGPDLPSENVPLEVIPEEIAPAAKLVIITSSPKTHGTPGSKSDATPVPADMLEACRAAGLNTVNTVKSLFATGFTRAQIVASGFNSSTVYRQVAEYLKNKVETDKNLDKIVVAAEKIEQAEDANVGK